MDIDRIIAGARRLHWRSVHSVRTQLAGVFRTAFRSGGLDFAGIRQYLPGDDVRFMDWWATARLNRPYVKQFAPERGRCTRLVLDSSASMGFRSRSGAKWETALETAMTLACAAYLNGDVVGLLASADGHIVRLAPGRGRNHLQQLAAHALQVKPGADAAELRNALVQQPGPRAHAGLIIGVTDLWGADLALALLQSAGRNETVIVRVIDPVEVEAPPAALWELEDPETHERVRFDTASESGPAAWRDALEDWMRGQWERPVFARCSIVDVRTDEPLLPVLHSFLNARRKRLR